MFSHLHIGHKSIGDLVRVCTPVIPCFCNLRPRTDKRDTKDYKERDRMQYSPQDTATAIQRLIELINSVSALYTHHPLSASEVAGLVRFIGDLKERLKGLLSMV